MKKLFIITLIILGSFVSVARADISPDKRAEIEKLLRLTGTEKLMGQVMTQMIGELRKAMPDAPPDYWDRFQQKINVHDLMEKIIPVYDKYYSIDDLKAINAFYESPAGQKMLASLPQVMKESMQIGQEWGEEIGREAAAGLQQEKKGSDK